MKVSKCPHTDFQIDHGKDGVGQDFALCKCKGCGLEFVFFLDGEGKAVKFWRHDPDPRNEVPDKKQWVQ